MTNPTNFTNEDLLTSEPDIINFSSIKRTPKKLKTNEKDEGWQNKVIKPVENPVFKGRLQLNTNKNTKDVKDFVNLIFTDQFFKFLLCQINKRIARSNLNASKLSQNEFDATDSKKEKNIDIVTEKEIRSFIGLNLFFGILKQPEIRHYWAQDDETYGSPFVKKIMKYSRFTEINTHFSLSSVYKGSTEEKRDIDESNKKIIQYLTDLFSELYSPNQELSIDEGMCKYQGRYSFKTYMPQKPTKIGMKLYF